MANSVDVAALYLSDVRARMRGVKALGDGALAQLRETDIHTALSADGNSAGVLVQHLAGNMRSRWGACASAMRRKAKQARATATPNSSLTSTPCLKCWPNGKGAGLCFSRHWIT